MALEGSIKDFSLADIFQLIGIQRKTGVLTLQNPEEEVKVSFLNGMVVNADSKSKRLDDRLGSVLVKTGKLSQDGLKRGLKVQKDTLKKLGLVLVEENLVRPEDLREALGIQITQIIYRLFRWKDGDYHFEQESNVDYDKENFTPMSAESILMEGMRMIDEWPIIERKIPSFDLVFERVPIEEGQVTVADGGSSEAAAQGGEERGDDFDVIFGGESKATAEEPAGGIRLTREEHLVYQQVNGEATVQEIIERTMLSEFETCRALYDLMNRNLIAQQVAAAKTPAVATRASGKPPSSALLSKVGLLAVAAALVFGVMRWPATSLNLLVPPPTVNPAFGAIHSEQAAARVRRVFAATATYRLLEGSSPASLEDLVRIGLISREEALDPWGRPLGFEAGADGVVVTSRTGPADDAGSVSSQR